MFGGVAATRGTYTIEGSVLTLKHVASVDPNLAGHAAVREFVLGAETLTLRGSTRTGAKVVAKFRRLKPLETTAQSQ